MVPFLIFRTYKIIVTLASISIFLQGSLSIVVCQLFINFIYSKNLAKRQKYLNLTKKRFILLLVTILSIVAPSKIRVTTNNETIAKGTFYIDHGKGRLVSRALPKSVVIANHQIYTDWVFLWWLAYVSNLGGNVYIMLKKSLESIPLLGKGMRNYKFIFMNRKWEQDKINLTNILHELDMDARGVGRIGGNIPLSISKEGEVVWDESNIVKAKQTWPYWLILFPEGTNLSAGTRAASKRFAEKTGVQPFKHVLLPRTTGLQFCLQKLRNSCDCVYDVTIGYSGVKSDEYGQDIYKLGNIFLKGRAPEVVDIYIRAIKIEEIPLENDEEFHKWLYEVWKYKDDLLESFYETGNFGLDPELNHCVTAPCKVSLSSLVSILALPILTLIPFFYLFVKRVWSLFSQYLQ